MISSESIRLKGKVGFLHAWFELKVLLITAFVSESQQRYYGEEGSVLQDVVPERSAQLTPVLEKQQKCEDKIE